MTTPGDNYVDKHRLPSNRECAKMSASRPELFRQAISTITGGFKRGEPRRFSALR